MIIMQEYENHGESWGLPLQELYNHMVSMRSILLGYFVSHITDLALSSGMYGVGCPWESDKENKQKGDINMTEERPINERIPLRIGQTQDWLNKTGQYDKDNPYHVETQAVLESLGNEWADGDGFDSKKGATNTMLEFYLDKLENTIRVIPKTQRADGSGLCSRVMGKVSTAPVAVQASNNSLKSVGIPAFTELIRDNQWMLHYNHNGEGLLSEMEDRDAAILILAKKMVSTYTGKNTRSWTEFAKGEVTGILVTCAESDGSDIATSTVDGVSVMATTYTPAEKKGRSD